MPARAGSPLPITAGKIGDRRPGLRPHWRSAWCLRVIVYTGDPTMSARPPSSAARILIVEDDPDIAHLLAHSLGRAGFTIEQLTSGTEVLGRVRRSQPDLLLLDL